MKEGTFLPWGRFLKTSQNSCVGLWLEQAENPSAKQQEPLPAQARAVCAVSWHEPGLSLKGAIPFSIQPSVCFPPAATPCFVPAQEAAWPTGTITRLKKKILKIVWVRLVSPAGTDKGHPAQAEPTWSFPWVGNKRARPPHLLIWLTKINLRNHSNTPAVMIRKYFLIWNKNWILELCCTPGFPAIQPSWAAEVSHEQRPRFSSAAFDEQRAQIHFPDRKRCRLKLCVGIHRIYRGIYP